MLKYWLNDSEYLLNSRIVPWLIWPSFRALLQCWCCSSCPQLRRLCLLSAKPSSARVGAAQSFPSSPPRLLWSVMLRNRRWRKRRPVKLDEAASPNLFSKTRSSFIAPKLSFISLRQCRFRSSFLRQNYRRKSLHPPKHLFAALLSKSRDSRARATRLPRSSSANCEQTQGMMCRALWQGDSEYLLIGPHTQIPRSPRWDANIRGPGDLKHDLFMQTK